MEDWNGKSDLDDLLSSLEPELHPEEFVYCRGAGGASRGQGFDPIGTFQDPEGPTHIVRRRRPSATVSPLLSHAG